MQNSPIKQSNECHICEESYTNTKHPTCLPCGHVLCSQCENELHGPTVRDTPCPFCRRRYHAYETRRIYNNADITVEFDRMQAVLAENRRLAEEIVRLTKMNADLEATRNVMKFVSYAKWELHL